MMKCPRCGQELRRSQRDPSFGLCDNCRKKFKLIPDEKCADTDEGFGNFEDRDRESRAGAKQNAWRSASPRQRARTASTAQKRASQPRTSRQQAPQQQTPPPMAMETMEEPEKKKKKGGCLRIVLIVLAILFLAAVVKAIKDPSDDSGRRSDTSENTSDNASDNASGITADKFNQITMGMSYDQVKEIIGEDGKNISEAESGGSVATMYQWDEADGLGNVLITIQDGAVISKTQTAILENNGVVIDLDKYNQINTGITYDEVKNIVGGDGLLSTETLLAGISSQIYIWYGEDEISNASVSFQDGTVSSKSQLGLE